MWLVCAIIAAILWGLNYAIAEKLLHSISPFTLLALEMTVGAIIFFIISYFVDFKTDLHAIMSQPKLMILAIVEILVVLIANLLIVYSIQLKNGTIAGIIELIYPLFTILFTWLLFQTNHVNFQVMIGGGLIAIGVIIISFA